MAINPQTMAEPVTKGDLAFVLADISISLRMIQTALLILRNGDQAEFVAQMNKIDSQTDKIWATFKSLSGQDVPDA